ncbi:hypothetical protein OPQ81_006061 [Rhizoctonia solani]|nr:hypothetical protein OPQ81_006061 [Rhizoctonia solani]
MRRDGESIDIWGAGGDFMLSILFFAVTICKIIVLAYGTSSVLYWYGVLSGGIVVGALMTSVAVAGKMYGLLKDDTHSSCRRNVKFHRNEPLHWVPYYVLAYGTLAETNEVLSPVCYLDDDEKGEWEWKGTYLCNQQKTHLKSYTPQVPYSNSLYEIKKHSPSDTDSSPTSQSGSDFRSAIPNRTRGSEGGSYACSIRTSVYGVIPLIEEADDELPMQVNTPNKYDALIKEWRSISTTVYTQVEKNGFNTLPKPLSRELKSLTLPSPWAHNRLSVPSPIRSRSRMKLVTAELDDPNSLQVHRSFTPFTEASEDSFYSIDTEDIPVSSSAYTDSAATVQDMLRDQSTPCPPTPQIPEITNSTEPEDDYVVLYKAWRCEPSGDVVLWT